METFLLTPDEVKQYHLVIVPWVAAAMAYSAGESSVDDIMLKLERGIAQCWATYNDEKELVGISTTEVIQYLRKKSLHVITTAGEFKVIGQQHTHIERFAQQHDCVSIVAWCRKGWSKVLDRYPFPSGKKYKQSYVVMEMEVQDEVNI